MNSEVRVRGLDARRSRRPVLLRRRRAGALAPRAANTSLVISIAMSQRTPSHCAADVDQRLGDRLAQRRARTRRAARRPATAGSTGRGRGRRTPPAVRRNASGSPREVVLAAADEALGLLGQPRVVGRDVVGHVVEDQPEPARGELPRAPRERRPGRRSARRRRSRARSTASRSRPPARRSGSAARLPASARDRPARSPGPAGLRSHTPISQTASTRQRGERVPLGGGHLVERERRRARARAAPARPRC